MNSSPPVPGKRRPGRPRTMPGSTHSIWCTDAGWAWLQEQSIGKGHDSVGKWADALGRAPLLTLSQARKREHGQPTVFERAKDGTNYAWSVRAVRERFGLSAAALGEEMGVSKRTVQGWEAGRMPGRMALEQLRKLATRLKPLGDDSPPLSAAPTVQDPDLANFVQRIINNEQPTTNE
jgi:DNA-binding transcriptional regulator YiaG